MYSSSHLERSRNSQCNAKNKGSTSKFEPMLDRIIAWISYSFSYIIVDTHEFRQTCIEWIPFSDKLSILLMFPRVMVSAHEVFSKPYNKHEPRITTQSDAPPTTSLSQSFRMVCYLEPSLCSSNTPSIQLSLDSLELGDLESRRPFQLNLSECCPS